MSTLYFRIFKKSTNKLKYLTSYKLYITSLKRYYSSTIYYKECAYGSKVLETLQKNRPVIILESTISHGVPYPQNLAIVTGNKPATTATLDGKINAYRNRLETFARRELETRKNFRASHELIETSTFSRSIFTAYRAGIKISLPVEFGVAKCNKRIPIAVVCTGARIKSIWNIRETLEYLETQGVLVSIFGEIKKYFQALFILKNGFKSQLNLKSIKESVGLINASTNSGLAISTPISTANSDETQRTIDTTLAEAKEISENNGVSLRINQAYSLKSNIPLVKNNAKINGNSKLELKGEFKKKVPAPFLQEYEKPSTSSIFNQEVKFSVDITSTLDPFITDYVKTSSPGTIRQSIGGVGRNIAETSFRLGVNPLFISAIGNDLSGNWLKTKFEKIGMETGGLQIINNESTAVYNAIHDSSGNLICAVADMKIFDYLSSDKMGKPKLVCFDGNISAGCIYNILNTCKTYNISTFFETTSISKSLKLLENYEQFIQLLSSQSLKYISPNSFELKTMYFTAYKNGLFDLNIKLGENGILLAQFLKDLNKGISKKNKKNEIIIKEKNGKSGLRLKYFKPIKFDKNEIVNVTGAGDSVVGTLVSGFILHGETKIDKIIEVAQYIALMTLKTHNSVSEDINEKLLEFSS
ncbi:5751_t:CDS:10 [Rhizophagus irregularis]|nr:5751_t:CDS:10 [Rhizophagus irregularis]